MHHNIYFIVSAGRTRGLDIPLRHQQQDPDTTGSRRSGRTAPAPAQGPSRPGTAAGQAALSFVYSQSDP